MSHTRILVCGGRDFPYNHRHKIYEIIDKHTAWHTPDDYGNTLPYCTIITGCASGVDTIAIDYAVINWTGLEKFPAQWKIYGRKAGPLRNIQMLDEGRPDLVIAINGGKGTQHTINEAIKRKIPVYRYKIDLDKLL